MEEEQCSLSPDAILAIVVPVAVYWAYSGLYMLLGSSFHQYRLHSAEDEDSKNLVSKRHVVKMVILQQFVQVAAALLVSLITGEGRRCSTGTAAAPPPPAPTVFLVAVRQFIVGMFVLDTWQYFWHRYLHTNQFLYRHVHSWHHRLVVPYSFGSQYNHPAEGFLLDTCGAGAAYLLSGMTPRTSIFFFSLCTVKGIDDHCGLWLPGNVFHLSFWNNTAYHDVHHQRHGSKYNFSQPFFVIWDKILGTHMPYTIEKRPGGGLQSCPAAVAAAKRNS